MYVWDERPKRSEAAGEREAAFVMSGVAPNFKL